MGSNWQRSSWRPVRHKLDRSGMGSKYKSPHNDLEGKQTKKGTKCKEHTKQITTNRSKPRIRLQIRKTASTDQKEGPSIIFGCIISCNRSRNPTNLIINDSDVHRFHRLIKFYLFTNLRANCLKSTERLC